jgi:trimeric autotransporter adhesin
MAYTALPEKSTGDSWTAENHNTYVKDNFASGVPDIFTTKGDLAVATAADTAARLAAGTNGHVLTADSGETSGIRWGSPLGETAYARYTKTSAQTISNTTTTIVNFDNEDYDSDDAVTTGAAWKFTVPADHGGYYLVTAILTFDSSAEWQYSEELDLVVHKNGATYAYLGITEVTTNATIIMSVSGSCIVSLAATDYIDIRAFQNSGADQTIVDDGVSSHVAIAKLF